MQFRSCVCYCITSCFLSVLSDCKLFLSCLKRYNKDTYRHRCKPPFSIAA
uniref:Uncharacterized protein n=1 Tax=Anguilla anguilla TaxID=7936 RepID=A0A0E9QJE1_ANGAN